ncbi:MAG: hypothetical protein K8T89_00875 [Planctomycetes bacterium]|nr:hypothetical protein [Planctomycetota bacterium]
MAASGSTRQTLYSRPASPTLTSTFFPQVPCVAGHGRGGGIANLAVFLADYGAVHTGPAKISPKTALPEGARVEILLQAARLEVAPIRITPGELRRLPREERQTILAAAAKLAEQDYRDDKELAGFDAFSEEEFDADETD